MKPSIRGTETRREFLTHAAVGVLAAGQIGFAPRLVAQVGAPGSGFDPWLEIDEAAFRSNARAVARLTGNRPIMAVVKNNAYGLGLEVVGPILDKIDEVAGLAVVKAEEAIKLRDAGVRKPILLMGLTSEPEGEELVRREVRLSLYADPTASLVARLGRQLGRAVPVHLYLDTGMSRMGIPYHRALPFARKVAETKEAKIEGCFMTFTEDSEFDPEQLRRFLEFAGEARKEGIGLGTLHAASSHALFSLENAYLDMVRPGLVLYGAYPSSAANETVQLTPAFRLRARVVRVELLRPGDSVSYGRTYVAERPTWVATLPVGHADGYHRTAVRGCEVLIEERLYRVIGAVSASHTIVEVGPEKTVDIGAEATLVGPDRKEILPNEVAARAGISVYDVLMRLSPLLPKRVRYSS
ncbi:MAG: alanine racemase [Gemmatimonadales bacterium]|nr:MAG: alanine racemase [Gemmatimonadales bacterium]